MGSGTGAPPLDLEGWWAMGSGGLHQFRRCCKDAEYLCRRSKIIQIERTEIRTSNVVQDSIKSMYDTIVVSLNTTINHTYNINVPKNKSQKNADTNIEDSVRYKAESVAQLLQLANFYKYLQAKTAGGDYSFNVNI